MLQRRQNHGKSSDNGRVSLILSLLFRLLLTPSSTTTPLIFCVDFPSFKQDAANTLLPLYNTCQLLFSGLLIRRVNIPAGWKWWTHTLFVRYGWQAQLMNHFGRDAAPKVFQASESGGELMGLAEYYGWWILHTHSSIRKPFTLKLRYTRHCTAGYRLCGT